MTLPESVLAGFFAALFIVIAARQFETRGLLPLVAWDIAAVLPVWRFFAPEPGRFDYHLLYRDLKVDGTLSPWREIIPVRPRPRWGLLWNPDKRVKKALLDIATDLAREHAVCPHEKLPFTVPYLVLLNHVSHLARVSPAAKTQFALFVSHGAQGLTPELLAASSVHRLQ